MTLFGLDQKNRPALLEHADRTVQHTQFVPLDIDFDEGDGLTNDAVEPGRPHLLGGARALLVTLLD